jgi:hypothetical protein
MRNTIRSYACVFSLIAALAVPLSAETSTGDSTDFMTRVTSTVIIMFEAIKVVMPPG